MRGITRGVFLGQSERREQLVSFRAGDEVVIPRSTPSSPSPSLDAHLVAEPPRGVSVHFSRTQEPDKPLLQRASQIVAKLCKILMLPLAGARASRQVALFDQPFPCRPASGRSIWDELPIEVCHWRSCSRLYLPSGEIN